MDWCIILFPQIEEDIIEEVEEYKYLGNKGVARVSGKIGHESNEGGQRMNEVTQTCNAS